MSNEELRKRVKELSLEELVKERAELVSGFDKCEYREMIGNHYPVCTHELDCDLQNDILYKGIINCGYMETLFRYDWEIYKKV